MKFSIKNYFIGQMWRRRMNVDSRTCLRCGKTGYKTPNGFHEGCILLFVDELKEKKEDDK